MKKILFALLAITFQTACFSQTVTKPSAVNYKFPITFIENAGQWQSDMLYANLLGNERSLLLKDGVVLLGTKKKQITIGETPKKEHNFTLLRFVDPSKKMKANGASVAAAKSNFYKGSDTMQYKQNVDNFSKVVYSNVWKNIDVEYGEENGKLTQTFIVKPGAGFRIFD